MSEMAERGAQVLFVQPNKKNITVHPKLEKQTEKIWILTCRGIPYERCFNSINTLNAKLSKDDILNAMKTIGFDDPIIWIDRVHGFDFNYFKQYRIIYDLVDEILAFGRIRNSKMLIALENRVLKNANLLISSSRTLLSRKIKQSNRQGENIFIPNGVDTDRFRNIQQKNQKNTIGFVGQISDRSINIELIHKVAQKHPEWKFVFTGPGTKECKSKLRGNFTNIIVNEPVTGKEIPEVIANYDVCIIPYLHNNPNMDYVFPRKACEYLASGKPVVSTNMNEIRFLQPMVMVSDDPSEFEEFIIQGFSDQDCERKREFAKQFDWNILMPKLLDKIQNVL